LNATFFLENGASDKSIREAYFFCQDNNCNQYLQPANSRIAELLHLTIKQRGIRIESKELTQVQDYKEITRELQDYKECTTFDSVIKKTTNYMSKNPKRIGLALVFIPILLYYFHR